MDPAVGDHVELVMVKMTRDAKGRQFGVRAAAQLHLLTWIKVFLCLKKSAPHTDIGQDAFHRLAPISSQIRFKRGTSADEAALLLERPHFRDKFIQNQQ